MGWEELHEVLELRWAREGGQDLDDIWAENQVKIQVGLCMMRSRDMNKAVYLEQSDDGLCI